MRKEYGEYFLTIGGTPNVLDHKRFIFQPQRFASPHLDALKTRLEHCFHGRPAAYYRRLRTYYRRWRRNVGFISLSRFLRRDDPYTLWVKEETAMLDRLRNQAANLATQASSPRIAIFIAVHKPVLAWLAESVASIFTQWSPHWELWLCTPADEASTLRDFLSSQWKNDARIKILAASDADSEAEVFNLALAETTCDFIGFLGQHDTLAPHALYLIASWRRRQEVDVFYSDEDVIDAEGRRTTPFFKPEWSPDLCLSSLYACRFGVYRRQLVQDVGGFRPDSISCLEYDLLLRSAERNVCIVHISHVLYHARKNNDETIKRKVQPSSPLKKIHDCAKRALKDALQRRAEVAVIEDGPASCMFYVRRQLRKEPLVSIIIPTRDRLEDLRLCIDSIEERTVYRNYELIIIDNGSREPQTLTYLASLRHRVLRYDEPFNFARLNNKAVTEAKGEYVLFLNNDMEVIAPEWLTALLEHVQRPEVGAVGARLFYADGTIQHAGVILGLDGAAAHAHKYLQASEPGYFFFPQLTRNYSAVTAACLMTRKTVYRSMGGMDERLAVTFNDVDFCLRLREQGYLIVYTPHATLYHHESRSRWRHAPPAEEKRYIVERWGAVIAQDPYYNPHLTLRREDFAFDLHRARAMLGELV